MPQTKDFYDELILSVGLRLISEEHPAGSGKYEPFITLDNTYYPAMAPVFDTARELGLPVSVMVFSVPTIFSGPGNATDGHNSSWFLPKNDLPNCFGMNGGTIHFPLRFHLYDEPLYGACFCMHGRALT